MKAFIMKTPLPCSEKRAVPVVGLGTSPGSKPRALVLHHDGCTVPGLTAGPHVEDPLVGIHAVPVHDGVGQRLSERQLHLHPCEISSTSMTRLHRRRDPGPASLRTRMLTTFAPPIHRCA